MIVSLRPTSVARATSSAEQLRSCLVDKLASWRFVGVDVDDALFLRVDLGGRSDLHRPRRPLVLRLGCRQPDQREPDAAHAADIGVRLHRVEEVPPRERRLPVPKVRPRHLVEDPRFLQPVAAGLERRKRLAVEVERAREVAFRGSQLREPAERQPSTFRVTQPFLDRERVGVAGARRVGVAREAVQDPVEGQSERLRPREADGAAAFDALRRPAEPRLDVAPEQREARGRTR